MKTASRVSLTLSCCVAALAFFMSVLSAVAQEPMPVPAAPGMNSAAPMPADLPARETTKGTLTKDRDGNFRIGMPYVADPAFTEKEGVPKGKVVRFTMDSADSKIYPTAAGGRGGQGGAFQRPVALYTPPGYVAGTEAPFIVVQDGTSWYVKSEAPNARADLAFIPTMLDNLIHEKRVPPMVAIMINPGPGGQRSIEYDTVSDKYTMFIENEVLPKITKDYGVAFTKDPDGRATFGESSGAAAAIAMAWFHPELYHRVISYSGTFVALRRDAQAAPHGAWEYHENFIPKSDPKPMRIWLEVGEQDNGANTAEDGMRNWVLANYHMADALKAKGYHYQFVFAEGVGHVSRPVQRQTMPEAFEWTWQGYGAKAAKPVALPSHAPDDFARQRQGIARGQVQTIEYDSKTVGVKRKAVVYTPPTYSKDEKYPALYLMHGLNGNETNWTRAGAANVILDNLYADKKIVPMIVVMPNGRANPNPTGGDAFQDYAKFENDLLKDLIPYMEDHFSIKSNRLDRALAGLSMGGGQALNFGAAHQEAFAWVGGFSSAPDTKRPADLVAALQKGKDKPSLLWLSCGDADGLMNISMGVHQALETAKIPHVWYIDSGAHTFPVWQNNLYLFSQMIFKPADSVQAPPSAGKADAAPAPARGGRGMRRGGAAPGNGPTPAP